MACLLSRCSWGGTCDNPKKVCVGGYKCTCARRNIVKYSLAFSVFCFGCFNSIQTVAYSVAGSKESVTSTKFCTLMSIPVYNFSIFSLIINELENGRSQTC